MNLSTTSGGQCNSVVQDIELCTNPSSRSRPPKMADERIVCPYRLPPYNTHKYGAYGSLTEEGAPVPFKSLLQLCASVSQTRHIYKTHHPQESFGGRCDPYRHQLVWTELMDRDTFHTAYFYELLRLSKVDPPWTSEALPKDTIQAMSNLAWHQRQNTLTYCKNHCYCFDAWVELNKVGIEKGFPQFPSALRNGMGTRMRNNLLP
jgi:hypothetical protein